MHNDMEKRKWWKEKKIKDVAIIAALALALLFACWKVFYNDEANELATQTSLTETEKKIALLLREIDGVGDASVMVCETEEGVQGVVVVCQGANDLQVLLNVREAVSAALGTDPKSIKIYLKKE